MNHRSSHGARSPSRRDVLKGSTALAGVAAAWGMGGMPALAAAPRRYPVATPALTTVERMLAFPLTDSPGLARSELREVARFAELGLGDWTFGAGLPIERRSDLMPEGHVASDGRAIRLGHFFAFSDVHITDKEAPNQSIVFQALSPDLPAATSLYSPIMVATTHVLDAAVQTANDLHRRDPFDFGIVLGDAINSTSYNETRWFIDVMDGGLITPSSGAHLGADSVDFQMPFEAPGLDRDIPWYQVLGNHDYLMIGSFPVDADPSLGFREAYVADRVWAVGNGLQPDMKAFPALFDMANLRKPPFYYGGVLDGADPLGRVVHAGPVDDPEFAGGAPRVAADPGRRSLVRTEWIAEFFATTSTPKGHGFDRVTEGRDEGFACYSFLPKPGMPLKVIVLDACQSEHDGSRDIHGHGFLDARRLAWLQAELDAGEAENQLMIIAAHIPIGVSAIGSEMEWWMGDANAKPGYENAVDLAGLVERLQNSPNLLMWIAGHRHLNVIKAFPSDDPARPERGFWQVETASLRDFPQQFRTFAITLNADDTVSIVTVNVDPRSPRARPPRRRAATPSRRSRSSATTSTSTTRIS
jgi:metallophosphoesterase (TIGR03768 family)